MRLTVDPTACRAVGICAHLATRVVRLDRWGYPVLPEEPVPAGDERAAQSAARACPHRALSLRGDG